MPRVDPAERAEVQSIVTRLVHELDAKRWDALAPLFTRIVRTDYTSLFGGEVQEQPELSLIETWRLLLQKVVTQHVLGPIDVDLEGRIATAHCHVRGYHHRPGTPGGDDWMVAGHYVFQLERIPPSWRIRRMTLETLYQTGNLKFLEAAASAG
jgi:SnoaL-like domain